jgi:hypothetical protein
MKVLLLHRMAMRLVDTSSPVDRRQAVDGLSRAITAAELSMAAGFERPYLLVERHQDCVLVLAALWREGDALSSGDGTREPSPVAFKTEKSLLRCCEIASSLCGAHSDLLLAPLLELAYLYESLEMPHEALLVVRQCHGLVAVNYGHDHIQIGALRERMQRLEEQREEQLRHRAAVKLQSAFKMRRQLRSFAKAAGTEPKRHAWDSGARRQDHETGICGVQGLGTALPITGRYVDALHLLHHAVLAGRPDGACAEEKHNDLPAAGSVDAPAAFSAIECDSEDDAVTTQFGEAHSARSNRASGCVREDRPNETEALQP